MTKVDDKAVERKRYVQFSKKCVTGVLICVNIIVAVAVVFMGVRSEFSALGDLMKYYLSFAGVVFISYCGNSAIEKACIYYAKSKGITSDDNG